MEIQVNEPSTMKLIQELLHDDRAVVQSIGTVISFRSARPPEYWQMVIGVIDPSLIESLISK